MTLEARDKLMSLRDVSEMLGIPGHTPSHGHHPSGPRSAHSPSYWRSRTGCRLSPAYGAGRIPDNPGRQVPSTAQATKITMRAAVTGRGRQGTRGAHRGVSADRGRLTLHHGQRKPVPARALRRADLYSSSEECWLPAGIDESRTAPPLRHVSCWQPASLWLQSPRG